MTLLRNESDRSRVRTAQRTHYVSAAFLSLLAGCGLLVPSPPAPATSEFPRFAQCAVSLTVNEGDLARLGALDTIIVRETSEITAIVMSPFGTKLDMLTLSDGGTANSQSGAIRPPEGFFSALKLLLLQKRLPAAIYTNDFSLTLETPCTPSAPSIP